MKKLIRKYFQKTSEAAPLAAFRIFFGIMMFFSIVRFWSYGWIDKLYIKPTFFFSYYGFEFVKPLGQFTYVIFTVCAIAAIGIVLGYKYRIAIVTFFLTFTYIELMDKTTYLNHYYFISVLSFLMIFLPANAYFSIDSSRSDKLRFQRIPSWTIDAVKLLLGIVYTYAGLAKLNSDWLFKAMPLKIWLPGKYDIPLLGSFMEKEWVHYFFSWSGAFYDLTIVFFLLYKRTRVLAFVTVVVFHTLTRVLFPIGMFPYIMIVGTLIFFDSGFHHRLIALFSKMINVNKMLFDNGKTLSFKPDVFNNLRSGVLIVLFAFQLLFPFRYIFYPGELFWTEEGYRFSWRVMLMEKAGYANFKIVDPHSGKRFYVNNAEFLSPFQEKQMATQPDFILQYAHFLKDHYQENGYSDLQVFVESYVALNGRLSKPYLDPDADLGKEKESFKHKKWILPFEDEIKGL